MTRVARLLRLDLRLWPRTLAQPLGILVVVLAVNILIFGSMSDRVRAQAWTGGLSAIYVVSLFAYVSAATQQLPFLLGLGVRRRDFYVATLAWAVLQSSAFGVVLLLLRLLEDATGGWGLQLRFFGVALLAVDGAAAQVLVYTGPFLLLAAIGLFCGLVLKRWGATGMNVLMAVTVVTVGLCVWVVSLLGAWPDVVSWVSARSTVALLAGLPTVAAAAIAGAGYLVVRRVTP